MKELCLYIEQNIDEQEQAWNDYQEYLSGFGIRLQRPDFAFKRKVRQQIKDDAGDSPYPGYDFGANECAHEDHDRQSGYYQEPSNGKLRNRPDHHTQHALGARGDLQTGLPNHQDQWSAGKVWDRMTEDEKDYQRRRSDIS